jgi:hypothetical protein
MGEILPDGKKPTPPKYSPSEFSTLSPEQEISDGDRRQIARLIGKYGKENVLAAVRANTGPRHRGRPSKGHLPIYEAIHLAQWFEEEAAEFREQGSKHPIRDAEIALYEMETGEYPDTTSRLFKSWRLNMKKKRLFGSRALREAEQVTAARNRWLEGRK